MKIRKHINEIFLEGISEWLRANGREADAAVLDGIDPKTFVRSVAVSNGIYGNANYPNKGNDGRITFEKLSYTTGTCKLNGDPIAAGSITPTVLLQRVPKPLRPKYLGNLGNSNTTPWKPADNGINLAIPGCRCYGAAGANGESFIVIVGSNENPADITTVQKYLPYDFGLTFAQQGTAWYGSDATFRMTGSTNVLNCTVNVLVWKGTSRAPVEKEVNQSLPVWKFKQTKNVAPEGYVSVPAFNVSPNWESLRGKYSTKVHFNRVILDAIESGLVAAGNTDAAAKIRAVNPETFVTFKNTFDTTNKKTIFTGSQCSTTKVFFESITIDNYNNDATITRMHPVHFQWVYAAAANISWDLMDKQATAKSTKQEKLIGENEFRYFVKHVPTGTQLTKQIFQDIYPFETKGFDYLWPEFTTAAKEGTVNLYNPLMDMLWGTFTLLVVADL